MYLGARDLSFLFFNHLPFKKMKQPQLSLHSLQEFSANSFKVLEADDLKLIVGAQAAFNLCSDSGDTDSKSEDCSNHTDTDTDPGTGVLV